MAHAWSNISAIHDVSAPDKPRTPCAYACGKKLHTSKSNRLQLISVQNYVPIMYSTYRLAH